MKFSRDRHRWIQLLLAAKQRYGISVLNYVVTSNHIHLIFSDDNTPTAIPQAMQFVAGRTAQEYNQRKASAEHTIDAIEVLTDIFPIADHAKVCRQLSKCLKGMVSQKLFSRTDIRGRCAAHEILIGTPQIAEHIRQGRFVNIQQIMKNDTDHGMMLFEEAIGDLIDRGWISPDALDR